MQLKREIIKNENTERVERNIEHIEWDLIQELKITATSLTLVTDSTIIEFDTKLNITGTIRRNKKNGK